ncbi:MAG: S-layer homology domain-containing protein [Oscillospiraceae bacterium]|nr:S-layer homology domain-containing protein [Oscillospiraceae bacterium]
MGFRKRFSKRIVCLLVVICLMIGMVPGVAAATPPENPPHFIDITGHWAYDAIDFMFQRDLMQGTSTTTFAPNLAFSRAMAVTILYRIAGEPAAPFEAVFSDVAPERWYSEAVIWAHNNEVVQGVGGGRFAPATNITRQEMATILHRFADAQGYDVTVTSYATLDFPDANLINDWAETAMGWAVYNGLMVGTDAGTLTPRSNATRAEAATILMRFLEQITYQPEPDPPTAEDFELTISVEETTLPQGEDFIVHVELKNNSGQDLEIATYFLFAPHIPGEHWIFDRIWPPWPTFVLFESGSTISRTIHLNWYYELSPGVYELTIGSMFYVGWEQPTDPENEPIPWEAPSTAQRINIVSNVIVLTVTNPAPIRTITATEGRTMMQDGNPYVLIDVRTEDEFRTRRIPGAILLPGTVLADRIAAVAPDRNSRIILYCQSGRRSAAAATLLAELGYLNIYDMGGIADWPYETVSG